MKETQKIRQKSLPEIKKDLKALKERLMTLSFEKETGSLKKNHEVKQTRKKIAQILTILKENEKKAKKSK